ncbi:hypothetical protein HBH70_149090 [Parastagonospora nodorum]|nr:hypothetical protein HBH47_053570 [Parastagonospora nodorum]KAH5133728.1 hypothetical protein HBH70_149090 [Parastagonospora nodorum]KAH5342843.1 hypothetical protein HBI48_218980 [Parastagonospora nodorum]KAH6178033.1 hypothetical protein HBI68_052910 [Parastagonospora nodorum]KAH6362770.1 hypothetical protein HBI36_056480 [Parastagonospora nodorum]
MSSTQGADFEVVACGRKTKKEYLGEHKRQEEMVGTYATWKERLKEAQTVRAIANGRERGDEIKGIKGRCTRPLGQSGAYTPDRLHV